MDQPAPTPNDQPAVWDLVLADMRARDAVGRERYGTALQPFNGRDSLTDAYQECLDLVVYLRAVIAERDAPIEPGRLVSADYYVMKVRRKSSAPDRPTWYDVRDAYTAGYDAGRSGN